MYYNFFLSPIYTTKSLLYIFYICFRDLGTRDQWKMRENHVFIMYYAEILFSFLPREQYHPKAQNLLTAMRYLLLALHLTKGFSNQVCIHHIWYIFYIFRIHFWFDSFFVRSSAQRRPHWYNVFYMFNIFWIFSLSPRNVWKGLEKTWGTSLRCTTKPLAIHAWPQKCIVWFTSLMTANIINVTWKPFLRTPSKISRASGLECFVRAISRLYKSGTVHMYYVYMLICV